MANQIKTSDFFSDDFIDKLIEKLKELSSTYETEIAKIKKEAADLKKVSEAVNVATSSGREENVRNAKAAQKLADTYKKLEEAQNGVNNELIRAQEDLKTVNRLRRLEAKQTLAAKDSYEGLSAEMSILKIRYKQLTAEQIKNGKEGQALTKRIKQINDTLKELDANVGVHTRNVGNYTDALSDLPGVLGSAGKSVRGLSDQFKALIKNPIILTIGIITGAIITLFEAFKQSESGSRLLAKGAGILNASFQVLASIAEELATKIINFVENPIEGIKRFGEALKENITNRFEGLLLSIGFAGRAVGQFLKGNFDEAKKAAEDFGSALLQAGTGLDEVQRKSLGDKFRNTIDLFKKATGASNDFVDAQKAIARQNRILQQQLAKLETAYELAQNRADDDTLSLRQQAQASTEAQAAAEALAATRIKIAKNNLALINAELEANKGNFEVAERLRNEQVQAIQEVEQAQRDLLLATERAEIQRRKILRDAFEQELDFAIDLYDARKRLLERQINDETFSFEERRKMYAKIVELDRSAFSEQIKLVEDFAGKRVDLNSLALIDDERIVRERLKQYELDEITTNRILEILKERAAATQDILEVERQLIKERNKGNQVDQIGIFNYGKAAEELALKRVKEVAKNVAGAAKEALGEQKGFSILSLLGLEDENEQKAVDTALDAAKKNLSDYVAAVEKAAAARVAASDRAVSAAENEYNRQVELQSQGLANTADTAQRELQIAQENQQKALEAQRRAQRQQILLDSVAQASNLYTAVSQVYKQLPFPFNIAASALMIGSFVAAKAKALAATRQEFAEGDLSVLEGGSHSSGNDIFIGEQKGKKQYAEGGEARMILSKRQTSKYMSNGLLPAIYQSLKAGEFEKRFMQMDKAGRDMARSVNVIHKPGTDTKNMESLLRKLVKQNEENIVLHNGTTIRKVRNWTITSRGN
jgi:hypothetical protein